MNSSTEIQLMMIANYFGEDAQKEKIIEELAELIVAIRHEDKSSTTIGRLNYIEELADVYIMAHQLVLLLNANDSSTFQIIVRNKINRTLTRISEMNSDGDRSCEMRKF